MSDLFCTPQFPNSANAWSINKSGSIDLVRVDSVSFSPTQRTTSNFRFPRNHDRRTFETRLHFKVFPCLIKNDPLEKDDPRLTSFVLGELSEEEAAEVQSLVAQSPELESAVEEIRQTVSLLGAAYQSEERLSLLDSQKAILADAGNDEAMSVRKQATAEKFAMSPVVKKPWVSIALAAGLLGLLVGGGFYFGNTFADPMVAEHEGDFEKI